MSKFIKHGDLRINLDRVSTYRGYDCEYTDISNNIYGVYFEIEGDLSNFAFKTRKARDEFLAKIDKLVGIENE